MDISWKDIGKSVASVAPTLAGALGGPVGAIAGAAGSLLCSALGVTDEEQAAKAIATNPEALVKIKELEFTHQARLLEWQTAQLNADLANITSARQREVELAKSGSYISWSTSLVALIVTVGFFVMLYIVISSGKETLGDAGLMLLGTLSTSFGAVIQYYLGSSLGSANKERMLSSKGRPK